MIDVTINKISFVKGEKGVITVKCNDVEQYAQLQIEIFNAGVKNPEAKFPVGTSPIIKDDNHYEVEFNTHNINCYGIYEIKLVIFHTPKQNEDIIPRKEFKSGIDFPRVFFEIFMVNYYEFPDILQIPKSKPQLEIEVYTEEQMHEHDFLSGIDIRQKLDNNKFRYRVFVFVKKLKIGKKIRFNKCEIFPSLSNLHNKDSLECVNDFLHTQIKINLAFEYQDLSNNNPVAIIHFPLIISNTVEEIINFCIKKSSFVLQALALTRHASGEIFDIMLYDEKQPYAERHSTEKPYKGNLLLGDMSGENANILENYIKNLEQDSFKSFLVNLYKQAQAEENNDFAYIRYWQILETLAESKNYNPQQKLLNFNNEIIKDLNGKDKKVKDSDAIVYQLLKENGWGDGNEILTWDRVNIWFAFRNAVAHYGTINEYNKLRSSKDKKYAEMGIQYIIKNQDHNFILRDIRDTINLLLQRELNR